MSIEGADQPSPAPAGELGEEWFQAQCTAPDCDRAWSARGTQPSRQARARAQRHADRTGHRIDAQHANAR